MSRKNFEGNHENYGDQAAGDQATKGDWLPKISEYEIDEVVCVAGKNPDDEKILNCCMVAKTKDGIGCPNLVPIAMIAAKPDEVIGKRRHQPNLEVIRSRLNI